MSVLTTACNDAAKRSRGKKLFGCFLPLGIYEVSGADRMRCEIAFSVPLSPCEMEGASLTEVP